MLSIAYHPHVLLLIMCKILYLSFKPYFRIKAFEDMLDQDIIDIRQLQRLAFNGKFHDIFMSSIRDLISRIRDQNFCE